MYFPFTKDYYIYYISSFFISFCFSAAACVCEHRERGYIKREWGEETKPLRMFFPSLTFFLSIFSLFSFLFFFFACNTKKHKSIAACCRGKREWMVMWRARARFAGVSWDRFLCTWHFHSTPLACPRSPDCFFEISLYARARACVWEYYTVPRVIYINESNLLKALVCRVASFIQKWQTGFWNIIIIFNEM